MIMLRIKPFDLSLPCIILVTVAVCLVFVMVGTSRFNSHPDEHLHFKAARYYMSYWDPPAAGDVRSRDPYSQFEISYLGIILSRWKERL